MTNITNIACESASFEVRWAQTENHGDSSLHAPSTSASQREGKTTYERNINNWVNYQSTNQSGACNPNQQGDPGVEVLQNCDSQSIAQEVESRPIPFTLGESPGKRSVVTASSQIQNLSNLNLNLSVYYEQESDQVLTKLMTVRDLNALYNFHGVYRDQIECPRYCFQKRDEFLILDNSNCHELFTYFLYFHAKDYKEIADNHGLSFSRRDTVSRLKEVLFQHNCSVKCKHIVYVFKSSNKEKIWLSQKLGGLAADIPASGRHVLRGNRNETTNNGTDTLEDSTSTTAAENVMFHGPESIDTESDSYLDIADMEFKKVLIEEWQTAMSMKNICQGVCAVCSSRVLQKDLHLMPPKVKYLDLLKNDALPEEVMPKTYNFEAYRRAILNPKGLTDCEHRSNIKTCRTCFEKITCKGQMPKLSLANWLYYGHESLPMDIKEAFECATPVEVMLISRCKGSKVCVRFSEIKPDKGRKISEDEHKISQKRMRGNVLVVPQDFSNLNHVLPPPPEMIADTFCAVFLANEKPDKKTIKKLEPLLARKTRVLKLLDFLITKNRHYKPESGFGGISQDNLDGLFAPEEKDKDEGVPCAIEIGQMVPNDAVEFLTSDYTRRNDIDPSSVTTDKILMENVGYTMGDTSPESYKSMKLRALTHCLDGKKFITSRPGSKVVPDFRNPKLLSCLFPHLDPWGIGGFYEPRRKVKISLEEQLSHMIMMDESKFEKDPEFAFTYYNICQKKKVYDSVAFSVSEERHQAIVEELLRVDVARLTRLEKKFERNPNFKVLEPDDRAILKLLAKVSLVGYTLPGTAAYKISLRNQIRGMMNYYGTPTLFVTLNPSDVDHPLVRLYAGDNINLDDLERGEDLDSWHRKLLVASNPAACALFFDKMVSNFIDVILRYRRNEKGLFGKCLGYYGTVETQGKGTLHCHMVIWLEGHLSPEALRDKMLQSDKYKTAMFAWLESIIKCEPLETGDVVHEDPYCRLEQPNFKELGIPNPGTVPQPSVSSMPGHDFQREYVDFVNNLTYFYNWHKHTLSCAKYLQPGEKADDENCRFGMNGSTRRITDLDKETLSILLRRLHPRIGCYNDLVTFLMQCNTDVKFIGSGEGAKALVYYITDYITKPSLPTHLGMAALSHAIQKTNAVTANPGENKPIRTRNALVKTVNSMMGNMEISHQLVMAYLIGGGDHYTNEKFQTLYLAGFSKLLDEAFPPQENRDTEFEQQGAPQVLSEDLETSPTNEEQINKSSNIVLRLAACSVTAHNQMRDYLERGNGMSYTSLCLFDFASLVRKDTIRKTELGDNGSTNISSGKFLESHPQYTTHVLRLRKQCAAIPVLLGQKIARFDRSMEERERWARSILMLFKPWRKPLDLKQPNITWLQAYNEFEPKLTKHHKKIIANMNVSNECKDARSEHSRLNKRINRFAAENSLADEMEEQVLAADYDLGYQFLEKAGENIGIPVSEEEPFESLYEKRLGIESVNSFEKCLARSMPIATGRTVRVEDSSMEVDDDQRPIIEKHSKLMADLRTKRRPEYPDDISQTEPVRKRRRINVVEPNIRVQNLEEREMFYPTENSRESVPTEVVEAVIAEMKLADNAEQLRAFMLVVEHLRNPTQQLTMYVGGVGGTGKSHVIKSVILLFEKLGRRSELMLSAPTGAAALLINGYTLHSLVMIRPDMSADGKKDFTKLRQLWGNIRYLVIDEVSMIAAHFLSQVSDRLKNAKGDDPEASNLPFGNINIIFTGDFGQLRPVPPSSPLFSRDLVQAPSVKQGRNVHGVAAMNGAFLWRQVNKVVLLTKNVRQNSDPRYAAFLGRLRVGECSVTQTRENSDVEMLQNRLLSTLETSEPDKFADFADAPIVVGSRTMRDMMNNRMIKHHAKKCGRDVNMYYAKDFVSRIPVEGIERQKFLALKSSVTNDALGRLPLFIGMRVMITDNLAFSKKVVNGAEGTVHDIKYQLNEHGNRMASVVYVKIPGSGKVAPDLEEDVIPIFPCRVRFKVTYLKGRLSKTKNVSRLQIPIVPGYSYTDYKSQGRSLKKAVLDLESSHSLQGLYVMLSRVTSLDGVAVLRPFRASSLYQRLTPDIREELRRLSVLDKQTQAEYEARGSGQNNETNLEEDGREHFNNGESWWF